MQTSAVNNGVIAFEVVKLFDFNFSIYYTFGDLSGTI